uniref:Uncharacterized protein n=2 Tax=Cacopsylla melanoneura TaxID=428564 RepID=A0A8D8QVZ7_9HEMI
MMRCGQSCKHHMSTPFTLRVFSGWVEELFQNNPAQNKESKYQIMELCDLQTRKEVGPGFVKLLDKERFPPKVFWAEAGESVKLSKTKLKRYVIKSRWIKAVNTILALHRMGAKFGCLG